VSVVLLDDVKVFLNISDPIRNEALQDAIDAAEAIIVKRLGFLGSTAYTDRVQGGCYALTLPRAPINTVTSITGTSGATVTVADCYIRQGAGVIEFDTGATFSERWYDVVYSVGYATTPDHLTLAVKELTKHLFKAQRGPTRPGSTAEDAPTASYLLPYRVQSLLDLETPLGFA